MQHYQLKHQETLSFPIYIQSAPSLHQGKIHLNYRIEGSSTRDIPKSEIFATGNGQVRPKPSKLEAVDAFPTPKTKKQVRTFLGLSGYYRRFIQNYASLAPPLSDLTRKSLPKQVQWTDKCQEAFAKLKDCLCKAPVLNHPDFSRSFVLQTDASDHGIGAVLSQVDDADQEHPVVFYSRKFLAREERYATVEKECLAIKLGVQAFKTYLLGRKFVVQIDHHALTWLYHLKENNALESGSATL